MGFLDDQAPHQHQVARTRAYLLGDVADEAQQRAVDIATEKPGARLSS
jgi:hypothetical protein